MFTKVFLSFNKLQTHSFSLQIKKIATLSQNRIQLIDLIFHPILCLLLSTLSCYCFRLLSYNCTHLKYVFSNHSFFLFFISLALFRIPQDICPHFILPVELMDFLKDRLNIRDYWLLLPEKDEQDLVFEF